MYLHRIVLDLKCKEARRDIADPYEMHSTLCRAFAEPEVKCQQGAFLWRLEPEQSLDGMPKVIVQGRELPDWLKINPQDWFWEEPTNPINIFEKLNINAVNNGDRFRYRLRANPSICKNGKRFGIFNGIAQREWFNRQGVRNGFKPLTVYVSEEKMLTGQKRCEHTISVFSVLYDGILEVSEAALFNKGIKEGIGHAKSLGLGLLSIVPVR